MLLACGRPPFALNQQPARTRIGVSVAVAALLVLLVQTSLAAPDVPAGEAPRRDTAGPAPGPARIRTARLGRPIRYPKSHGDLWNGAWADDGELYIASNDTLGFDRSCSSNLAIHRLLGDRPPCLQAQTINPMRAFGGWGEIRPEDGAMWKASGLTCVDGVLYLAVSRHANPSERSFFVQQAWDASLVKSPDHGRTWGAAPELGRAMFPGPTFCNPFFIDYGRAGTATVDGADRYVYAASSDGVWNNGSSMTLGRVARDRIGRLEPRDWEFVHGFDDRGQPIWRGRLEGARYIFRAPGRTSQASLHFLAPLGLYLLPQWHYTHLDDPRRRWKASRLEFYQAARPWGPWERFFAQDFEPEGWYDPRIPTKFASADGRRLWLFVAGDWTTSQTIDGYYGLFMIPVELDLAE